MSKLAEKVAIVTGGGRGIGRAIARRFAAEGAAVVIADQQEESGRETSKEIEESGGAARFIQTDVAVRASVETLAEETQTHFGQIDILVNNAAILGENGPFLEVLPEVWHQVISVNQTGVFVCSQVVGCVMARAGRGNIINISSVNGLVPQPRCVAYAASKAAVESMTRCLAAELAPYNIRVNVIAPGSILSREPDDATPKRNHLTLLGRTGLPLEVAAVALFLASDESSYITGERIAVDGGKLINGYQLYGVERPFELL